MWLSPVRYLRYCEVKGRKLTVHALRLDSITAPILICCALYVCLSLFIVCCLLFSEMKLLRPLAGYTFHDHKTNDSVRRELQTECILDKIDEYRRNWLLHLQRMPLNRIPLKSYHYRPQGRRTIGRPKKRWREQL